MNGVKQALFDRLEGLQETLDELVGRQLGGDGRNLNEHDEEAVVPPELLNVNAASHALLRELSAYPREMRILIERRLGRSRRVSSKARHLRRFSQRVVEATALIEDWFAAPAGGNEVSSALSEAVQKSLTDIGLPGQNAIVTTGPPNRLETVLTDAKARIFAEVLDSFEADEDEQRPRDEAVPAAVEDKHEPRARQKAEQEDEDSVDKDTESGITYAVFKVPAHEARSPRWWPVVLGHEIAHHRLRADERHAARTRTKEVSEHPEVDTGRDAFYVLRAVGIDGYFPVERMEEVLREEAVSARVPSIPPRVGGEFDAPGPPPVDTTSVTGRIAIANTWAEELLCDLAMVRRFGPAAVVALANYLIAVGNYEIRSPTHPPGYFRVQRMLDYLGDSTPELFAPILEAWSATPTRDASPPPPAWMVLLLDYLRDHTDKFHAAVNEWPGTAYDMNDPMRQQAVTLALRQLSLGLPPFPADPNHFPLWVQPTQDRELAPTGTDQTRPPAGHRVVPTDADIINAGWLAVASRHAGDPNFHTKLPVDRLLMKSLETQQLHDRLAPAEPDSTDVRVQRPSTTTTHASREGRVWTEGSVLGAEAIRDRLNEPDPWRRIIVTPWLDDNVTGSSIDLRLSNRFIIFQRTAIASFNVQKGHNARAVQRLVERPLTSPFVLHPGEVVLASAMEYLALPEDIAAQVITRSSYGRLGLITATAVQVHPLYRGCLTLELVNLGTVPMTLHPGERVAQLVFLKVTVPVRTEPPSPDEVFQGSFVCPTGPEFPSVSTDPLMARLRPPV